MIEKDIQELKKKIEMARSWARNHLNYEAANNTSLIDGNLRMLPPSFFVKFPTPDTMEVSPSIMGKPIGIWIKYRLAFYDNNRMEWHGKHPLYQTPFTPLVMGS